MRGHRAAAVSIGVAWMFLTTQHILSQEMKNSAPPTRSARPVDKVWEAARQEAEAKWKGEQAILARLRAVPPPPPAAPPDMEREELDSFIRTIRSAQLRARPREEFTLSEDSFEGWLFGSDSAESRRAQLDAILTRKIEEADRMWELTVAQREKLRLAGRGDMERLFHRVEDNRRQFLILRTDVDQLMGFYLREIRPLRRTILTVPYGEGSIFSKVLKRTLEEGEPARRRPK